MGSTPTLGIRLATLRRSVVTRTLLRSVANRRVRKPAKRPSSNLGDRLRVRLPPLRLEHASAGHWRAQVAVTHPHCCAGSTPARRTDMARSSIGSGPRLLTPARGVRFPYGLLTLAKWWNGKTRSSQKAVPIRAWEFDSPLGHFRCRRAGVRQILIRSARPARYRGLQLSGRASARPRVMTSAGQVRPLGPGL